MGWDKRGPVVMMIRAVLSLLLVGVAMAQTGCNYQTKCDECVQVPNCMWCSKFKDGVDDTAHCLPSQTQQVSSVCDGDFEDPQNTQRILVDEPLSSSDKKHRKDEKIIQLKPQRMKLNLRKGIKQDIKLTYKQAVGYPIDLYYLMDLSNSMLDDKETLAELGSTLTDALKNLTEVYQLGFGSFVDKVMLPFVDTHPQKIDEPCVGCERPYSFRNNLPLGTDGAVFSRKVRDAKISGNLDSPEGGFDALMQVLVCDEIKWRSVARRIIVFSTDAKFHHAGDGKLAGVVIPNDEKCHLDDVGEYDAFNRFDYPSIAQINKVSKEKDIYIIFAVSNYEDIYKDVSKFVENSSYGKLTANSDNVVDLVRYQYNKITSKISLSDNASNAISIQYKSNCKDSSAEPIVTKECSGIVEGDQVTFTLEVKLNDCPANQHREIVEVKTLQDSFIMEIDFQCSCGCEKPANYSTGDELCDGNGFVECGVCSCFEGFRGVKCHCTADGAGDDGKDKELCRAKPEEEELCSGNGHCVCGSCDCYDEDITGKFCNCNQRKCLSERGESCSGRGTCSCETCSCNSGYEGNVCECRKEDACRKPGEQEICSGHGDCDCGKCSCHTDKDSSYSGEYCDDCLTCSIGKCSEFNEMVLCRFHNPTSSSCNLNTTTIYVIDSVKAEHDSGARLCSHVDEEDGCKIIFTYRYMDDTRTYVINIQRKKECPAGAPILGIVFGILAGIVAIGLLTLLIWKLLTTIHDRNEYAKFEKERQNARWNAEGNPLYKDPTNTFLNPAFSQQQALTD